MMIVGVIGSILVTAVIGENEEVIEHNFVEGLQTTFMKLRENPFYVCASPPSVPI